MDNVRVTVISVAVAITIVVIKSTEIASIAMLKVNTLRLLSIMFIIVITMALLYKRILQGYIEDVSIRISKLNFKGNVGTSIESRIAPITQRLFAPLPLERVLLQSASLLPLGVT